jgi:acetyl-CoA carboxylase carboxyltransferase component
MEFDAGISRESAHAALAELHRRRRVAAGVGGAAAVERAHSRGLLTAPERIELLLDPGSLVKFGTLFHSDELARAEETYGDGDQCGFGTIDGRWVAYFASDSRVKGASGGPASMRKSDAFRNIVERASLPLVYLMQGGGARIDDVMTPGFIMAPGTGMGARKYFPRRGALLTAVLGSYYAPWNVAHADFSVMTADSNISLTAPPLVLVGTGQQVTPAELGGAAVQARVTGQIDAVVPDESAAIAMVRKVFGYLPTRAGALAPVVESDDPTDRRCPELYEIVPEQMTRAYDVRQVIESIVDRGTFIEYSPEFAQNMVTGLARVGGEAVVVIANQPKAAAGVINVNAVLKARKALALCGDLGLPLVSFVDTPGVLPTREEEHQRLMTMLYQFGVARLAARGPKVVIVLRKGVGFGLQVMSAGDPEAITFVWPNSQICFTGVEACVRVVHRRELEDASDPAALMAELSERYRAQSAPWSGAHLGYLDDVIDPAESRVKVARALAVTRWRR